MLMEKLLDGDFYCIHVNQGFKRLDRETIIPDVLPAFFVLGLYWTIFRRRISEALSS